MYIYIYIFQSMTLHNKQITTEKWNWDKYFG